MEFSPPLKLRNRYPVDVTALYSHFEDGSIIAVSHQINHMIIFVLNSTQNYMESEC